MHWSARIDPIVEASIAAGAIPGAAVVVVHNGTISFAEGYGSTTVSGQAIDDRTRFSLGSVSKSFVGLALIALANTGDVDLDASVSSYLPYIAPPFQNREQTLSVRHLLNHTSGYSTYLGNSNQDDQDSDPANLHRSAMALGIRSLATKPGTHFEYSNANYQVLGDLIESVTGSAFSSAMQDLVFEPIGMSDTQVGHPYHRANAALGYRFWGRWLTPWTEPMGAALMPQGGISSSARDIGQYLIALTGGNARIPDMWDPALAETHGLVQPAQAYAAGWFVRQTKEHTVLYHHGLNPGFGAAAAFSPDSRKGVAIMINASQGFVFGNHNALLDSVIAQVFPDTPKTATDYTAAWMQSGVLCGLLLAILLWMARFFRRPLPSGRSLYALHTWGPSLVLVALGYVVGWWLPRALGIPISGIIMFSPDIGWLLFALTWLAMGWAVVRCVCIWLRRASSD